MKRLFLALACVTIILVRIEDALWNLRSGTDELNQLAGAINLLEGHGVSYAYSDAQAPAGMSYKPILQWPPGYSWLAAAGIFLTRDLYDAVILNRLFFTLLQLVSAAWLLRLLPGLSSHTKMLWFCAFALNTNLVTLTATDTAAMGGYTLALDNREQGFRLRHWVFVACGPLVNVLFVLAALAFLPRPVRIETVSEDWDPVKAFLAANVLTLVFNLFPRKVNTSRVVQMTDGLQLLRTPFMNEKEVRTQMSLWYALPGALALQECRNEDAMRIYDEGVQSFPESLLLRLDRCLALIELEQCEEARQELLSLLGNPQLEKGLRPFCLNNLAAADVLTGKPELLDEADRCSTEAMAIMAWSPVTQAARAAVLVEWGRLDEGIALARQSIDQQEGDKARMWNAVTLAIAYKRSGNEVEGRKYFDLAARAGLDGPRMRRVREMYGSGIAQ